MVRPSRPRPRNQTPAADYAGPGRIGASGVDVSSSFVDQSPDRKLGWVCALNGLLEYKLRYAIIADPMSDLVENVPFENAYERAIHFSKHGHKLGIADELQY